MAGKEIADRKKIVNNDTLPTPHRVAAQHGIDKLNAAMKQNADILRGHEIDAAKGYAKGTGKIALTGLAVYGGYKGLQKLVQTAKERPKSWIGKKIAALRHIYSKYMNAAENTTDKSNSNLIKSAAHKILTVIDKLMAILQKHAG
jgi:hypothetical protein